MNQKFFLSSVMALAICCSSNLLAQVGTSKNNLSVSIARAYFSTGGYEGWGVGFGYERALGKRVDIGSRIGVNFGSLDEIASQSKLLEGEKYPVIMKDVDNAFPDFIFKDKEYYERGIASFQGNSDRLLHVSLDILANFKLVNRGKHSLRAGIGAAFTYAEEASTVLDYPGTFDGRPFFAEDTPIRLLMPAYARWVDVGILINFDYAFKLSERTNIGIRGTWHDYLGGSDWITSGCIFFGVNF